MSTPPATLAGVNVSLGTVSSGAWVESSPYVREEDEVDDSPSPELGGGVGRELRWLGAPAVRQGRTRGEQRKQFDLDWAVVLVACCRGAPGIIVVGVRHA